jgi:hypothetical protein
MPVTSSPMLTSTSTMMMPLRMAWVDGESPLIQPAGPDCGLSIHAVMHRGSDAADDDPEDLLVLEKVFHRAFSSG